MFHGAASAALAVLALAAGLGLGMAVVVSRDGRAARRMDRSRP